MQSGKIKHWNSDKGYGFIDVDNQSEDVFFHIKSVQMAQPISEGQRVYFNSERNDKNQLRATEVTSDELSILETSVENPAHRSSVNHNQKNNRNHTRKNNRGSQNKKSSLSTLFSLIAIIAVAVYFFADIKSSFFADSTPPATLTQNSIETASTANAVAITGDAQIDQTIALIQQGGPFSYPNKDGTKFYNREGKLPAESQGYYREYTVPTPTVSHRGARRIVTGGHPPTIYYLTLDHYDSFQKLEVK
ncbi:possible guanine-specific ribonuclease with a cold-shock DNA-binding domain protein [Psychrobacter arcticus 273-4]|uniref:Possible guanine-specific ribonuclease with a cold-shock DNA-binding domain protein n=1 Tax=Psychrobacter arcticus (strain DSM 17307 / VKM B-2377 / 273-4) TaxID=259536 RepID=Q4FUZ6_PSYA2|nr:ribonuclease domain-containing protein [Psychrobacter arcticus]AAZ18162.1 possible guanine-specific ribonuclease with a cold-shock DNA-binding domain protein [Psychrobacter arcticus 273-4]